MRENANNFYKICKRNRVPEVPGDDRNRNGGKHKIVVLTGLPVKDL
jgi:hypothetical protein